MLRRPEVVSAQHQSLLHFVSQGNWSDENVMTKERETVLPQMQRSEPIKAWIIDDTAFAKQGIRRRRGDGRGLRQQHRSPREHHEDGIDIRCRHCSAHHGMGTGK
jgi:DDE superfamily endonuclease